jgi:hypothetical protein
MIALSPSPHDRPFHGLWSLWDMLEFDGSAFYTAVSILRGAQGRLKEIQGNEESDFKMDDSIPETACIQIAERLRELNENLSVLDAKMTMILTNRALGWAEKKELTWQQMFDYMEETDSRLRDELTLHKLFVLESDKTRYFEPAKPLFGEDTARRFVSAAFEIDEAAKCLALERPTACVFHLMRTMEIAIRAIARCLNIPDPTKPAERNWGAILKAIKGELDSRAAGNPPWNDPGDRELIESAYASLDAVRVAWRNTTMHVENKYTGDEAEHIFIAVRGFMMKLASRCDENGDPKA